MYFLMYILTTINNIKGASIILSAISFFIALFSAVNYSCENSRKYSTPDLILVNSLQKIFRRSFITFIVFTSLATLLPTSKQLAFIVIAPQIIENGAVKDTVKNIPEITKLGTEYLKQLLEDKVK